EGPAGRATDRAGAAGRRARRGRVRRRGDVVERDRRGGGGEAVGDGDGVVHAGADAGLGETDGPDDRRRVVDGEGLRSVGRRVSGGVGDADAHTGRRGVRRVVVLLVGCQDDVLILVGDRGRPVDSRGAEEPGFRAGAVRGDVDGG